MNTGAISSARPDFGAMVMARAVSLREMALSELLDVIKKAAVTYIQPLGPINGKGARIDVYA